MGKEKLNKNSLEFPREARRSLKPSYDPEAFGRWSEKFARFLGTARFLVFMTAFVIFWVTWNRDRIQANEDRDREERNIADTQYLTRELASLRTAISEVTTRDHLHGELANAIEEIVSKLNKKS